LERPPIWFALFCTVAGVAFAAMVVTAISRRSHAAPAPPAAAAPSVAPATKTADSMRVPVPAEDPVGVGLPPGYRSTSARNYMRMRLRELTMAEEMYYNENSAYTTDISKLQLARRTGDVVVLRVIAAGPAGWSGEATHPALPGKSCVTYAGVVSAPTGIPQTAFDHAQPLGERDFVCDKP